MKKANGLLTLEELIKEQAKEFGRDPAVEIGKRFQNTTKRRANALERRRIKQVDLERENTLRRLSDAERLKVIGDLAESWRCMATKGSKDRCHIYKTHAAQLMHALEGRDE